MMRGNIVDLAVGVVVGVAFTALVQALTDDFINPLIQLVGGGEKLSGTWKVMSVTFQWGDFVTQIINFLLVAAALYFFVVMPMNKLNERRASLTRRIGIFGRKSESVAEEPPPPTPADIALLTQIRDSLAAMEERGALAQVHRSADPGSAPTAGDR